MDSSCYYKNLSVKNMISKARLDLFNKNVGLKRGAPFIKEISWYLVKIFFFLTPIPYPNQFKCLLLRLFGSKVGNGVIIKPRINIHFPWKLEIGNHVWIGEEVFILNFEKIVIGNHVCISQRTFLCGGNHDYKKPEMPYKNGQIILHDGCWIGANVFVSPNIEIGVDTVVSACSFVNKNLEPNSIYAGNPVVYIRQRWG